MKSYILLENALFYAYHGVCEHELQIGNVFVVNLKIEVDIEKSGLSDELDDTLNYGEVYKVVKQEMDKPSKLLEHVAYRIMQNIKEKFPRIGLVELKVSKRNPPVGGQVDSAGVLLID